MATSMRHTSNITTIIRSKFNELEVSLVRFAVLGVIEVVSCGNSLLELILTVALDLVELGIDTEDSC